MISALFKHSPSEANLARVTVLKVPDSAGIVHVLAPMKICHLPILLQKPLSR